MLHAGREIPHFYFGKRIDAEFFKQHALAFRAQVFRNAVQFAEEIEEIVGGKILLQFQLARQKSYLSAHALRLGDDIRAVQNGGSFVRSDQGRKHTERGGFSRAVRPQKPENLPLVGGKREIVHRDLQAGIRAFQLLLSGRKTKGLFQPRYLNNVTHTTSIYDTRFHYNTDSFLSPFPSL